MNYYNEHDPKAAAWLRELINAGVIPDGHVDERSIVDVQPEDLSEFTQCHFFAGIGGWPFALQLAGWDSARPVWTGSCPCQPFSAAGKRKGTSDERHLWPEMFRLIRECKPNTIFGEQVASPDAMRWLDGVSTDLEGAGYAVGAADLCAAGVGAPHIRQRLYWLADSEHEQRERSIPGRRVEHCENAERPADEFAGRCEVDGLADMPGSGSQWSEFESKGQQHQAAERGRASCGLVQSNGAGCKQGVVTAEAARYGRAVESTGRDGGLGNAESIDQRRERISGTSNGRQSAIGGPSAWSDYDIIQCLDGKARRIESQSQPLADGVSAFVDALRIAGASEDEISAALNSFPLVQGAAGRVMLLKGYGNAIVPQVAAEFVRAFMGIEKIS